MQRAVGGHQVQAQQIGYETSVQSQPVTSGLHRYGAESSSDHGKAPRRPYSGSSKNRWPPTTPSGFLHQKPIKFRRIVSTGLQSWFLEL
ncbi:hypothetical protein MRX96_002640 [Rhipicephalus microplus]